LRRNLRNTPSVAGKDGQGASGLVTSRSRQSGAARNEALEPPAWVSASPLLSEAFLLAASAHRTDQRPSDGRLFIEHVTEVAGLLRRLDFDEDLVAVGLLHDSVERGRLTEAELRTAIGGPICALVMVLSEDPAIESFEERKAALRERVAAAGGRAVTVFAADKLSDIAGLRRGIDASRAGAEARMDTSVSSMADHYRDSVQMIASLWPGSAFLSALRRELEQLEAVA
jgi:(p)ppGpp synthase/HD superfamily hydrolase